MNTLPEAPHAEIALPLISIIVPVLHETETINEVVAHVKALPYQGPREIIVVDGAPGADTLAGLVHADVLGISSRRGRGAQMNRGATMARGDVLLFLHADTHLPDQGLALAASAMRNPDTAAGAFSLSFDHDSRLMRLAARLANLRNKLTRTPYGDQALFFRTEVFRDMRGFKDQPLMEDVEIMRRLRKEKRGKVLILDQCVRTSARRYREQGAIRAMLRNLALRALYGLGVPPRRLVRFYRAHGEHP